MATKTKTLVRVKLRGASGTKIKDLELDKHESDRVETLTIIEQKVVEDEVQTFSVGKAQMVGVD